MGQASFETGTSRSRVSAHCATLAGRYNVTIIAQSRQCGRHEPFNNKFSTLESRLHPSKIEKGNHAGKTYHGAIQYVELAHYGFVIFSPIAYLQ